MQECEREMLRRLRVKIHTYLSLKEVNCQKGEILALQITNEINKKVKLVNKIDFC